MFLGEAKSRIQDLIEGKVNGIEEHYTITVGARIPNMFGFRMVDGVRISNGSVFQWSAILKKKKT